jgi:enterochelin esterase-like enzyme
MERAGGRTIPCQQNYSCIKKIIMITIIKSVLTGLCFFLISIQARAQTNPTASMLTKKGLMLKSSVNGKTYQLYVSLPIGYNPEDTVHYPVLYMLDGNYIFPLVSIREMLDLGKEISAVIIVAIGDSDQALPNWFFSRWTDYTISHDPVADSATASDYHLPAGVLLSGGADAFLQTIRKDIIPFIDKNYKTSNDRGIAGHSLGVYLQPIVCSGLRISLKDMAS